MLRWRQLYEVSERRQHMLQQHSAALEAHVEQLQRTLHAVRQHITPPPSRALPAQDPSPMHAPTGHAPAPLGSPIALAASTDSLPWLLGADKDDKVARALHEGFDAAEDVWLTTGSPSVESPAVVSPAEEPGSGVEAGLRRQVQELQAQLRVAQEHNGVLMVWMCR